MVIRTWVFGRTFQKNKLGGLIITRGKKKKPKLQYFLKLKCEFLSTTQNA